MFLSGGFEFRNMEWIGSKIPVPSWPDKNGKIPINSDFPSVGERGRDKQVCRYEPTILA